MGVVSVTTVVTALRQGSGRANASSAPPNVLHGLVAMVLALASCGAGATTHLQGSLVGTRWPPIGDPPPPPAVRVDVDQILVDYGFDHPCGLRGSAKLRRNREVVLLDVRLYGPRGHDTCSSAVHAESEALPPGRYRVRVTRNGVAVPVQLYLHDEPVRGDTVQLPGPDYIPPSAE